MARFKIIIPVLLNAGLLFLFSRSEAEDSHHSSAHQDRSRRSGKPSDYIKRFLPLAKQTESLYKVPEVFTLAQGGLESDWGTSGVAINANNHFGIKADSKWYGPVYNGYRKYNSVQEGFDDHAKFITTNKRYNAAFNSNDPIQFGQAIAAAGYSENPNYGAILTQTINNVKSFSI